MSRIATVNRETKETKISCTLNLDGTGKYDINTGIGFFDHMLSGFARHGLFDLTLKAEGDLYVDSHHTVEDVGIVLGQAIKEALGEKAGICRYGFFILPMDETLMLCALDLSGRPYFSYDVNLTVDRLGEMDVEMAKEFFYAIYTSHRTILLITFKINLLELCLVKVTKKILPDMILRHFRRIEDVTLFAFNTIHRSVNCRSINRDPW